ncbi:MAG: hypothetical protein RLZZ244_2086 [Verrucomicrobiota bacterium]
MRLRITALKGLAGKRSLEFALPSIRLGTHPECDVRLDPTWDRGVAPIHTRIEFSDGQCRISDAGSRTGTLLNGTLLRGAFVLTDAAEIQLGPGGPRFQVELDAEGLAAHASPPRDTPGVRGRFPGWLFLVLAAGLVTALAMQAHRFQSLFQPKGGGPATSASATESSSKSARNASSDSEDAFLKAFRRLYAQTPPKSAYGTALLNADLPWFSRRDEFLQDRSGCPTPGVFVGEFFHPKLALRGIPPANRELIEALRPALLPARDTPPLASVIQTSLASTPTELQRRALESFRTYSAARPNESSATRSRSPKAWALLVGINRFESTEVSPLAACRNDVAALFKVLSEQGIFEKDGLRLMTDARGRQSEDYPSRKNILAALGRMIENADPEDVVFIAFSSHGGYDAKRKEAYLCAADTFASAPGIFGSELQSLLSRARAHNILFLLDACHSGGTPAIGGATALAGLDSSIHTRAGANRIPESFYQSLAQARGHVVIRACRADQSTLDLGALGQGLLTAVTVCGLGGEADLNGDGIVTLSELRIYITTAIPQLCRYAQEAGFRPDGPWPLEPTFTSAGMGEAGDLPLTVRAVSTSH